MDKLNKVVKHKIDLITGLKFYSFAKSIRNPQISNTSRLLHLDRVLLRNKQKLSMVLICDAIQIVIDH